MGNCLPFSKYAEASRKHKSSEDNTNSQAGSSVKDPNKLTSDFDFNSKEEIYFDSNDQAWLDSDVEDFQSVTSDSTPTDIGTSPPLNDDNSRRNSQSDGLTAVETSSADGKKQLIDLFRDSFTNDVNENNISSKSRQSTPNRPKSPQASCCLPNLVRSRSSSSSEKMSSSSNERKNK